ncbi:unnamed protein product [Mucor hiemalis]
MREDLIKSAESFLSSANEIEEAFKRVGGDSTTPTTPTTNTYAPRAATTTPPLPPRPSNITQIVYYPPAPIPRMTTQQLIKYALAIGFGAFGFTVALTMIIKKIMSRIFNKIAYYQSDRYQQNTRLLKESEETVKEFTSAATKDISFEREQTKLNESLDRLVEYAAKIKEKRQEPYYKGLKSNIEKFRNTILQNPYTSNQFDYTSGMASSFANRYQVENNRNAAIQNIKSEIRSFKGMLLSRRNFPIVSTKAPVVPPPSSSSPTTTTTATPPVIPKAVPGAFSNVDANFFHPRRKAFIEMN